MEKNNIKLSKKSIDPRYLGSIDDGVRRIFVGRAGLPERMETNLGCIDYGSFTAQKGVIFPEEMKIILYICENFSLFYDNIQE